MDMEHINFQFISLKNLHKLSSMGTFCWFNDDDDDDDDDDDNNNNNNSRILHPLSSSSSQHCPSKTGYQMWTIKGSTNAIS